MKLWNKEVVQCLVEWASLKDYFLVNENKPLLNGRVQCLDKWVHGDDDFLVKGNSILTYGQVKRINSLINGINIWYNG